MGPRVFPLIARPHGAPSVSPDGATNTNYILLGMILEQAGQAKASEFIRQRALMPAGLSQAFLEGAEVPVGQLARGFDAKKTDITFSYAMSGPWTAGAMVASGADRCNWVEALYGETKVLGETEKKLMVEGGHLNESQGAVWVGSGDPGCEHHRRRGPGLGPWRIDSRFLHAGLLFPRQADGHLLRGESGWNQS
jgi:CubicO group peptidase (beta-lactamase class C family)